MTLQNDAHPFSLQVAIRVSDGWEEIENQTLTELTSTHYYVCWKINISF